MPELYQRWLPIERVVGGKPTGVLDYGATLVAPHGATTRWTYTVPSNTAAAIEMFSATLFRDAVAAPVGKAIIVIATTPTAVPLRLNELDNTLGARATFGLSDAGFLAAGDVVFAATSDASTGGSHSYDVSLTYREFAV